MAQVSARRMDNVTLILRPVVSCFLHSLLQVHTASLLADEGEWEKLGACPDNCLWQLCRTREPLSNLGVLESKLLINTVSLILKNRWLMWSASCLWLPLKVHECSVLRHQKTWTMKSWETPLLGNGSVKTFQLRIINTQFSVQLLSYKYWTWNEGKLGNQFDSRKGLVGLSRTLASTLVNRPHFSSQRWS
jgi:hypothetical protein